MGAWTRASELVVEFGNTGEGRRYAVEGIEGQAWAMARIVDAGTPPPVGPHLRLRPVVDPPGPFDLDRIIWITPFLEKPDTRETLITFEERIGRRYYEFMAAARIRYSAACDITWSGIDLDVSCGEAYAVDAGTKAELKELDASTSPEPLDVVEFYKECSALKVPGSGRQIFLLPPGT
jgi:hypothetical protein